MIENDEEDDVGDSPCDTAEDDSSCVDADLDEVPHEWRELSEYSTIAKLRPFPPTPSEPYLSQSPKAVDPRELKQWIEADQEALPLSERDQRLSRGLTKLDRMAPAIVKQDERFFHKDETIEYIIAAEIRHPAPRLRAVVSRAYGRACQYAEARQIRRRALDKARWARTGIANALDALKDPDGLIWDKGRAGQHPSRDGVLAVSDSVLRHLRVGRDDDHQTRSEECYDILHGLYDLEQQLNAAIAVSTKAGRPAHDDEFFFLLRLAEAYILLTGEMFSPDGRIRKRQDNRTAAKLDYWPDFALTAMNLAGLEVGTYGQKDQKNLAMYGQLMARLNAHPEAYRAPKAEIVPDGHDLFFKKLQRLQSRVRSEFDDPAVLFSSLRWQDLPSHWWLEPLKLHEETLSDLPG